MTSQQRSISEQLSIELSCDKGKWETVILALHHGQWLVIDVIVAVTHLIYTARSDLPLIYGGMGLKINITNFKITAQLR